VAHFSSTTRKNNDDGDDDNDDDHKVLQESSGSILVNPSFTGAGLGGKVTSLIFSYRVCVFF